MHSAEKNRKKYILYNLSEIDADLKSYIEETPNPTRKFIFKRNKIFTTNLFLVKGAKLRFDKKKTCFSFVLKPTEISLIKPRMYVLKVDMVHVLNHTSNIFNNLLHHWRILFH